MELAGRRRVAPTSWPSRIERGARVAGVQRSPARPTPRPTSRARCADRSPARSRSAGARRRSCSPATCSTCATAPTWSRRCSRTRGSRPRCARSWPADDHRLVVLPGIRDSALAHDAPRDRRGRRARRRGRARRACSRSTPASAAASCTWSPGHRLDPSAAFVDPRDPNDRPLAQHLVREIGPGLASAAGIEHVARRHRRSRRPQPGRRVRRVAARVPAPAAALGLADHPGARRARAVLVVLRADRPAQQRQPARPRDPAARRRAHAGARGRRRRARVHHDAAARRARRDLVVGPAAARQRRRARRSRHARRRPAASGSSPRTRAGPSSPTSAAARSTRTVGSGGRVVECVPARAGFPPVFVERHAVLVGRARSGRRAARAALARRARPPELTSLERIASPRERMQPSWPPTVVARHPGTVTWPSAGDATAVRRRTRRIAATAIALGRRDQPRVGGDAARSRAASARCAASRRSRFPKRPPCSSRSAGVGLLFLARGVRRGQRHAWSLALALLLVSVARPRHQGPRHRRGGHHAAGRGVPRDRIRPTSPRPRTRRRRGAR